jgi:hypothetical protein
LPVRPGEHLGDVPSRRKHLREVGDEGACFCGVAGRLSR